MSSLAERIAIGAATLAVVILTITAAFLLARDEVATPAPAPTENTAETPTEIVVPTQRPTTSSPTDSPPETPTHTPTSTPPPIPTDTPSPTDTPVPPIVETPTPELPLDTPTATPTIGPPTDTPTATRLPNACHRTPLDWVDYQIQRGDTWDTLSRRIGLSVFDLQLANCSTQTLQPIDIIYLPFKPPTPTPTDIPTSLPTSTPIPTIISASATPTPIAPIIEKVVPHNGPLGQQARLLVFGRNFGSIDNSGGNVSDSFRAEFIQIAPSSGTTPLQIVRVSSTDFEAIVPATLPEGCYHLLVINPANRSTVKEQAYTNNPNQFSCDPNATSTPTPTPTFTPTNTPIPTSTHTPTATPTTTIPTVTATPP